MANIGGEGVGGPVVGGGTPAGIVDFRPRTRGTLRTMERRTPRGQGPAPTPAGPRGAGRDRTARQAGISRPTAPRAAPTARGAGALPRAPRAGAGGGGGVPRQTRVPTAVPTRVSRPTNVIQQQGPAPSQTRAGANRDARQLIREETERRNRIRSGAGFRAIQALRNR